MRRTRSSQFVVDDCRCSVEISEVSNRCSAAFLYGLAVLLLCNFTGGCSSWSLRAGAEQPSFEDMLSAPYAQTKLKKSLTLDVLPKIQRSQGELTPYFKGAELLSQGRNVVASLGQSEDGHRIWFNMVAFHEFGLNVMRKYFFVVDDKEATLSGKPRRGLRFDCEMVLPAEVLEKTYADENSRQIAILRHILDNLHKDMKGLNARGDARGQTDKTLIVCGMLMNQTFEIILR
ncbi:MAG: hypothetical protein U9Q07_11515, partial [Planctomycetota bacterium]|nr:hypothetical protein [Planctomycetota bacterium]